MVFGGEHTKATVLAVILVYPSRTDQSVGAPRSQTQMELHIHMTVAVDEFCGDAATDGCRKFTDLRCARQR